MQSNLIDKVNKLNEYFHKQEIGTELTTQELNDQKVLRDEIIDYIKFASTKLNK